MINLIEKKQLFLINKTKKYFAEAKNKGIDTSKSSLCYLNTYSPTPGFAKILFWLKDKNYIKKTLSLFFQHVISIIYYSNFTLINNKKKNYKKIIITWGNKSDFKKNLFFDKFTNISSNKTQDTIFFVIYLDNIVPNHIPKNVVLLFNKKKINFVFLIKVFFKTIIDNNFSLKKIIHYLSVQTIFAEIVNQNLNQLIGKKKINKIIIPYEGQPFQNYLIKNLKKKNKDILTLGFIHSMLPALPLNFIKKDGSPDYLFLSGNAQKKLFYKYLGWKKTQLKVIDSIRIKKKIKNDLENSLFFAMYFIDSVNLLKAFKNFLHNQKIKIPKIIVKKHPQMMNNKNQIYLEKKINKLMKMNKLKFDKTLKKNFSYHLGPTSAFIQYLESKKHALHFTALPILDVYTKKLWHNIIPQKIDEFIYKYKLTKKRQILRLSDKNYNIKKSKII